MPGQFGLPANAQGLFAASEEQQKLAQEQAAQTQALAAQQAEPISTEDLVANMQAAKSQGQQNLATNQVRPTPEQLAQAEAQAPAEPVVKGAIPEPAAPSAAPTGPQIGSLTDNTTETRTKVDGTAPANIAQIDAGVAQQKLGAKEQVEVNVAKSLEDLEIAKQAAAKEVVQRGVFQAAEDARAEKVRVSEKASADAIDEVARTKINPNAYFQELGMGGKVLSLIGVALGGMGAGTGPNVALEIFEKASQANIDAQKANLSNKREVASFKNSAYGRVLEATGNERQAQLTQQAADLGMFRRQLETTVRNPALLSKTQKAAYDTTMGQIDTQYGKLKAEIQKTSLDKVVRDETKQQVIKTTAHEKAPVTESEANQQRALQSGAVNLAKLADGFEANSKEIGPIMGNLNKLKGRFGLDTKGFKDLDSAAQETLLRQAKSMLPGTLTDNDIKRIVAIIPDLTTNPAAAARGLRRLSDESVTMAEGFKVSRGVNFLMDGDLPEYAQFIASRKAKADARKAGK